MLTYCCLFVVKYSIIWWISIVRRISLERWVEIILMTVEYPDLPYSPLLLKLHVSQTWIQIRTKYYMSSSVWWRHGTNILCNVCGDLHVHVYYFLWSTFIPLGVISTKYLRHPVMTCIVCLSVGIITIAMSFRLQCWCSNISCDFHVCKPNICYHWNIPVTGFASLSTCRICVIISVYYDHYGESRISLSVLAVDHPYTCR